MVIFAFLVMIVVLVGCLCSLWGRPSEGIGLPIIAIAVFAFIYLLQPAYMIWDGELDYFLTDAMVVKALLVSAAALFCLMWGWRRGGHGVRRLLERPAPQEGWDAGRLYRYGMAAACVGTVLHVMWVRRSGGFLQAYGQMHGLGLHTAGYTAYIYMGMFWVLSGVAMMIISGSKRRLTPAQQMGIAVFAGAYALNGLLQGSRHDVFAICAVVWVGWSLARRSRPSIDRAAPALAVACLGALLMVGYRSVLYLSSDTPEAPEVAQAVNHWLGVDDVGIRYRNTEVEFVVCALALETVDQTQKYDFAISWLEAYTLHLIPRVLWPDKPILQVSMIPESPIGSGISQADVREVTGVTLANGTAPGIIAEMYMSFGMFSLLFFMCLGWCGRRLLLRAEHAHTPFAICAYTMALSHSLNVFGQGFGTMLVPFAYSMAPVVLYYWAERHYRRRSAREHAGRQPRGATLVEQTL